MFSLTQSSHGNTIFRKVLSLSPGGEGGGGGLPYITDGDARRNFQKKPLKFAILGVPPANFIP